MVVGTVDNQVQVPAYNHKGEEDNTDDGDIDQVVEASLDEQNAVSAASPNWVCSLRSQ